MKAPLKILVRVCNLLGVGRVFQAQVHGRDESGNYCALTVASVGTVLAGGLYERLFCLPPMMVQVERIEIMHPVGWHFHLMSCGHDLVCPECGHGECSCKPPMFRDENGC
jgi:hypothetical protein